MTVMTQNYRYILFIFSLLIMNIALKSCNEISTEKSKEETSTIHYENELEKLLQVENIDYQNLNNVLIIPPLPCEMCVNSSTYFVNKPKHSKNSLVIYYEGFKCEYEHITCSRLSFEELNEYDLVFPKAVIFPISNKKVMKPMLLNEYLNNNGI